MSFYPVIVCGGRYFADEALVITTLDRLRVKYGPLHIIQGGATGADRLAFKWAQKQPHVLASNVPANWKKHGRSAGPVRNQQMIDDYRPKLVVAFQGGKGTADMVRRAKVAGIEILQPMRDEIS